MEMRFKPIRSSRKSRAGNAILFLFPKLAVISNERQLFAFAGMWDAWTNKEAKEILKPKDNDGLEVRRYHLRTCGPGSDH